ncbi:MAG: PP0621 family protein [Pseudomonadota bacterium]
MSLIRLIALAVIFWLLYRLILKLMSKAQRHTPRKEAPPSDGTMVRCERCGLHVPEKQALTKDGKAYCCEEHRDSGPG